jgi:hypothetical protein
MTLERKQWTTTCLCYSFFIHKTRVINHFVPNLNNEAISGRRRIESKVDLNEIRSISTSLASTKEERLRKVHTVKNPS